MWSWQVGGAALGAVGDAVDDHRAHAADAFAAVVIEGDGLLAAVDEVVVEDVEHLQEGGVLADALDLVLDHLARGARALLAPDMEGEVHYL
jgi:hypothetical protein